MGSRSLLQQGGLLPDDFWLRPVLTGRQPTISPQKKKNLRRKENSRAGGGEETAKLWTQKFCLGTPEWAIGRASNLREAALEYKRETIPPRKNRLSLKNGYEKGARGFREVAASLQGNHQMGRRDGVTAKSKVQNGFRGNHLGLFRKGHKESD